MTAPTIDRDRTRLQTLLRDLFQFDAADLDFGIYRILNLRREEIEQFIERDLLDAVDEALDQFQEVAVANLEQEMQEKRQAFIANFGPDALDEAGEVVEVYQETPAARAYHEARRTLVAARTTQETRRLIFNDLYRFFSRYYDQGDFLSERRYSSREPKYAIPYNGEEVLLYWANRDQYYVKTSERHADYRFTAGDLTVWFRLQSAQEPANNVKGDTRYFVLSGGDRFDYDETTNTLTIHFEYRPLTDTEGDRYLAAYNALLPRSSRRKSLDRSVLVEAMETLLLEAIDRPEVKQALARAYRSDPESRSVLGYHLNRYTARNTMDYFVHKDLGGFLRRELDYFLKNEVLQIDDVVGDESGELARHTLARMRSIRHVAQRIISFLAQVEDFQKALFEKKKFVVRTDYCVTLDRVPESLYPEILANEAQLAEWRDLYAIEKWDEDLFWNGAIDEMFLRNHPYVMVDTRFFDAAFTIRLLETFEDLDAATNGILVHGENFQALGLLHKTYSDQVRSIYIDPPYNAAATEILYKNEYKHSSWLSLLSDRLLAGRSYLEPSGMMCVTIDDYEFHRFKYLLDQIFETGSHLATVVIRNNPSGRSTVRGFAVNHEYGLFYAESPNDVRVGRLSHSEEQVSRYSEVDDAGRRFEWENLRKSSAASERVDRPKQFFPLYYNPETEKLRVPDMEWQDATSSWTVLEDPGVDEQTILPVINGVEKVWGYGRERVEAELDQMIAKAVDDRYEVYKRKYLNTEGTLPRTWWDDTAYSARDNGTRELRNLFGPEKNFDFPKAVDAVQDSLRVCNVISGTITLDYFAGSGTTAQAVIGLNREDRGDRKYILVEMGDHFYTVLKPRIQKVVFASEWKDGVPQNPESGVSHTFKYQHIESYEDALNNIVVERPQDLQLGLFPDEMQQEYMLHYLLDVETLNSPTLAPEGAFDRPFDYQLLIQHGHESPRATTVDLVETFHYLIGMHVRRLEQHQHQERCYVISRGSVRTENGIEEVAVIWRDTEGLDLEAEAAWAHATLFAKTPDRVYVNGKSFIANAEPLEYTFRNRMLEEAGRGQ